VTNFSRTSDCRERRRREREIPTGGMCQRKVGLHGCMFCSAMNVAGSSQYAFTLARKSPQRPPIIQAALTMLSQLDPTNLTIPLISESGF